MNNFENREFANSLRKLYRSGGKSKTVFKKVITLLERISKGDQNPFSGFTTINCSKQKIKNLVEYDAYDNYRLLTAVYGKNTIFLFVGTHEDVDKWFKKNSGIIITMNSNGLLKL